MARAWDPAPDLVLYRGRIYTVDPDDAVVRSCTKELRRRLEAAQPDVLLMLSNDHLPNWPINTPSTSWRTGTG